ncbi:MAG: alkaline phosphatase family protein [Pseudomonadota bacterium]
MNQPLSTLVLAGPVLRRTTLNQVNLWMATAEPVEIRVRLYPDDHQTREFTFNENMDGLRTLIAGKHLFYHFISLNQTTPLPSDTPIEYTVELRTRAGSQDPSGWHDHTDWAPDLCYPGYARPFFRIETHTHTLLHGSCRKPHHDGADGLVAADRLLTQIAVNAEHQDMPAWPAMLVMSGDQIYADDVAGPMLSAIHALIEDLGLTEESLQQLGAGELENSTDLYHTSTHYARSGLLPRLNSGESVLEVLFKGVRKPVFTSINADNHLITLAEILAMYLLVWSPTGWQRIDWRSPENLDAKHQGKYEREDMVITEFTNGLGQVRRVLAHIPSAMIFDDHDITDDWNLNRQWEEAAYDHPFSRRVIGNAMIGYLINQAWGNRPELFDEEQFNAAQAVLDRPGISQHDEFIERLLSLEQWDFSWPCDPPLVVLDTRTRRWRSESSPNKPSGLLDWEALTDLQRQIREMDRVLLVSAAPIFGVKLIESIQMLFTFFGKPLVVDSEYWLAHKGTASGILNVFKHRKTPKTFVVLSGDVHYSFVYDVELRGRHGGPNIWQICSSGIRNEFPDGLLRYLDHLNRWLYSTRSPLNWLTRRRTMRVIPRKPQGTAHGRRILNGSGIGIVELDDSGAPTRIMQLLAQDDSRVIFNRREEEARWD